MGAIKNLEMQIRGCRLGSADLTNDQKVLMEAAQVFLGLNDMLDGIVSKQGYELLERYAKTARVLHGRTGQLALALASIALRKPQKVTIKVIDRCNRKWRKIFRSREKCRAWLNEGLAGTEGAEQEHYANMLVELNCGATILHYN